MGGKLEGKFWRRFLTWVLGGVGLKEWLMWVGREEDHESIVYFIWVFSGFFFFIIGSALDLDWALMWIWMV